MNTRLAFGILALTVACAAAIGLIVFDCDDAYAADTSGDVRSGGDVVGEYALTGTTLSISTLGTATSDAEDLTLVGFDQQSTVESIVVRGFTQDRKSVV